MFGKNGQDLGTKNRAVSSNKTGYKETAARPPAPAAYERPHRPGGVPGHRAAGRQRSEEADSILPAGGGIKKAVSKKIRRRAGTREKIRRAGVARR